MDHLGLPANFKFADRRQGGSNNTSTVRDAGTHGRGLQSELTSALAAQPRQVVEGVDPRRVFKLKATSRLNDNTLPNRGLQFLGDTDDWTYFVVPDDASAETLSRELAAYAQGGAPGKPAPLHSFYDLVEHIALYGPEDRLTPQVVDARDSGEWPLVVDVNVWPSPDASEAARRVADVRRVLEEFDASMMGSDIRPQSTVVRARCGETALDAIADLMVVERIRLPMVPLLEPSSWLRAQPGDFTVLDPLDVTVGVIDDGIAAGHPLLDGVVAASLEFPLSRPWKSFGDHGTMVAGLAAYGGFEEVLSGGELPQPVRVIGARVLEPIDADPLSMHLPSGEPDHQVIEQAIRTLHGEHGVRVFNLSITDTFPYSGPHVGTLTETLDRLVRELDVVIVVAAGNRAFPLDGKTDAGLHALDDYPAYLHDDEARLAEPAPAANVVTVGSLGLSDAASSPSGRSGVDEHAVATRGRPSPFSRTGPGVTSKVKPELADFGGDLVWGNGQISTRNVGVGVVSLISDFSQRLFGTASGTSFAAPRVANLAARLLDRYPGSSANLLRALLVLAASHPERADFALDEKHLLAAIGAGRPTLSRSLDSDKNRVVMIGEGEIGCDSVLIQPIPIPDDFARGKAERLLSIALAFDPPVRRQRREYLAGRIGLDLYRNMTVDEIAEIVRKQDGESRTPTVSGRRRVQNDLRPTAELARGATAYARRWERKYLNVDDGDTYYVALTHRAEPWADRLGDAYTSQRYALAVELWDRERAEIDLYNAVQNRVSEQARARVRV